MTDEQINKRIAAYMGVQYWSLGSGYAHKNLNYISEESPRSLLSEVESRVIAEFGIVPLHNSLLTGVLGSSDAFRLPFATARQRCLAILAVIGEK